MVHQVAQGLWSLLLLLNLELALVIDRAAIDSPLSYGKSVGYFHINSERS